MLEHFDREFAPKAAGFAPGLESITDGTWTITILSAELTRTQHTQEDIVRWDYMVEGAHQIQHATFLRTQKNANALGSDLLLLGIPTNTWTAANGKLFSHELPKALSTLAGIRFRAQKTTTSDNGRTYHNLKILSLAGANDMPTNEQLPF